MSLNSNINTRIKVAAGTTVFSAAILLSGLFGTVTPTYAATPLVSGGKALVTNTDGDNIRMRSGAGTDNDQIAEAHEGETVSIVDGPQRDAKGNRWFKVKALGGIGWVVAGYLEGTDTGPSQASAAPKSSDTASSAKSAAEGTSKAATKETTKPAAGPNLVGFGRVANTDGDPLRVRNSASSKGDVIAKLTPDTSVAIKQGPLTDSDGITWYQISANGVTGWAMAQYLSQAKAPDAAVTNKPVEQAAQKPVAPAAVAPAPATAPIVAQPAVQKPVAPAPTPKAPSVVIVFPTPVSTPVLVVQPAVSVAVQPAIAQPVAKPAAQVADTRSTASRGAVPPDTSSRGSTIVSTAMRYVGYRYRFGGTSPSGFDCSGFVYYVLNHSGVSISRDMYSQLNSGPRVSSKDLRPGDLLFFSGTYKRGLSHAGIYIGNGRFVHAENESTGVAVSDLWSSYWAAHYTAAVRPSN